MAKIEDFGNVNCVKIDNGGYIKHKMYNCEIIEYITIRRSSRDELDTEIESMIEDGFQPYGNPYIYCGAIHQVMVKYKK
jgi:hypothetical protein